MAAMRTVTLSGHFKPGVLAVPSSRISRVHTRLGCKAESQAGVAAEQEATKTVEETTEVKEQSVSATDKVKDSSKDASKIARDVASTFAPRPSGAVKNPAVKGSLLYKIFGWQAWGSAAIGGLLAFNVLLPSDEPSIARLMGMWSVWMFTIPSLRARECTSKEKDALNILFLLVPLVNVALPFVSKSFATVYSADLVAMAAIFYWKLGPPSEENPEGAA
ncbi:hypothetical protein BSKO_02328 [Bryopsis sp. KO-2023]|nr:hypothetical protein BSKO_02328 [Bryopsis sp. KO-2023]